MPTNYYAENSFKLATVKLGNIIIFFSVFGMNKFNFKQRF